jgi:hypothetical protein
VKSGSRQTLSKRISDVLCTCAFDEFDGSISHHDSYRKRNVLVYALATTDFRGAKAPRKSKEGVDVHIFRGPA